MKTKLLASIIASAFWASAGVVASADPASRAPDFLGAVPKMAMDHHLAASSGTAPIDPFDDVAFQFGSAVLLSSGQSELDAAAAWLRAHPDKRLVIEGHTDRVGTTDYNEDLATRRAETVRQAMIKKGIPSDRMLLVIYGEASPDDRRAVLYATDRPIREIVAASIDRGHAEVAVWTNKGTLLREERTPNAKREVIATQALRNGSIAATNLRRRIDVREVRRTRSSRTSCAAGTSACRRLPDRGRHDRIAIGVDEQQRDRELAVRAAHARTWPSRAYRACRGAGDRTRACRRACAAAPPCSRKSCARLQGLVVVVDVLVDPALGVAAHEAIDDPPRR